MHINSRVVTVEKTVNCVEGKDNQCITYVTVWLEEQGEHNIKLRIVQLGFEEPEGLIRRILKRFYF